MNTLKFQISTYKVLNDTYRNKFSKFSSVQAPIKKILTSFSNNNDDFLRIKGRLLTAGTYVDDKLGTITILPEDLQKSMSAWKNIPIYTKHSIYRDILAGKDPSIREILGKIIDVEWNNDDDGIDFIAEISDRDVSRKIEHGIVKYISAGFMRDIMTRMDENMKTLNLVKNIEPGESSMVYDPRDSAAEFRPVEA